MFDYCLFAMVLAQSADDVILLLRGEFKCFPAPFACVGKNCVLKNAVPGGAITALLSKDETFPTRQFQGNTPLIWCSDAGQVGVPGLFLASELSHP